MPSGMVRNVNMHEDRAILTEYSEQPYMPVSKVGVVVMVICVCVYAKIDGLR